MLNRSMRSVARTLTSLRNAASGAGNGSPLRSKRRLLAECLENRRLLSADLANGPPDHANPAEYAPAPPTSLRFAMLGDFGDDSTAEANVAALVAAQTPDIVVTAGDNRYGSRTYEQVIGNHYGQYVSTVSGGTSAVNRFFPAPGNHDYNDGGGISQYLNYFDLPGVGVTSTNTSGNERYYDVIEGPVHFFFIDSDEAISNSTDRAAQQTWLQTQMSASTAPWQVVLLHHAPFSSANHGSNSTMQWNYAGWGADAVLAGHDHTYERIGRNGIPYFVNGLGGRSIYNFNTPIAGSEVRYNADYGAMIVDATDAEMTFQFLNVSGTVIDTYTVTPNVIDAQIMQSSDDAEERASDGFMYLTSSDIELGNDPGTNGDQTEGLRFQNLGIPQGATITSAYLEFEADANDSVATSLTIRAQDADDTATFSSTAYDLTNRPTTAASVSWTPAAWTNRALYQSPDLSTLVQEVVDRNAWTSGNSMTFIVSGSGERTAESFDGDAASATRLHVEFSTALNLPPDAHNDSASTDEGNGVIVSVLANDPDPDLDTLSVASFSQGTHGSVTDNGNGTLTYTPAAGFSGLDSFTYSAGDGRGGEDTATVYLTVSPTGAGKVDSQISQSSDDAEERGSNGGIDLTSSDIELGDDPGFNEDQTAGLRFQNITIPQGAAISSAYLEFETDELDSATTNITIRAQASDTTATFTTAINNITSRPTTSASVSWDIEAWDTVSELQRSPDLAGLIQEVVDRSGWASGNSVALLVTGTGSRTAESYDGESAGAAKLHIEYTNFDFGDAPATFATLRTNDGARHFAAGPRLGDTRDVELDGQPTAAADGDGGDEDGVMFGMVAVGNTLAGVNINLQNAATAKVDAWIDFNRDGVWDAAEKILDSVGVSSSVQTLNYILPAGLTNGDTFARVRLSTAGGLDPTGPADDGEVEDYLVKIVAPPLVERVIINGDDAQRSSVSEVVVMFNGEVVAPPSAFTITARDSNVILDSLIVNSSLNPDGKTISRLTFGPGNLVESRVSGLHTLVDGNYQLDIVAAQITAAGGGPNMENDYTFGDREADAFFRYFGDDDGDRDTDVADLVQFGAAFRSNSSQPNFNPDLDHDGDGDLDVSDLIQFGQRFRGRIDF